MTRDEIVEAGRQHLFPAVRHLYSDPLVIDRAKDQYVWDAEGRQYLDFFGGIVVISVGHLNDKVREAVHRQVDRLHHASTLFPTEPQAALAKRIAEVTPGRKLTKSFFTNSGTEANETAVALARVYTGNFEIIALRHSYHGRSDAARSLSGQSSWRGPLPLQAGYVHAHNAYCYRCPFGKSYPSCGVACARDVEELIATSTSGQIAALIAEPIQGIGGFITPPAEYFETVVEIVRRRGGVFIADEVQTAWGRTGKWFGIEQYGVTPDIMTSAKGLGNGFPIGMTTARAEVADSLQFSTLSTFGGNPVSTAAAKAVIDFVEEHDLPARCERLGAKLRDELLALQQRYPLIGDVRGMGLMQALELVRDRETKEPADSETLALLEAARRNGLLIGKGGLYGNCIRISPPMIVSEADIAEFARLLDRSFADVSGGS